MVSNGIAVDNSKCVGCRICELICSMQHGDGICYVESRIRVIQDELKGVSLPIVCILCDGKFCTKFCPTNALYENPSTNAITIRKNLCIGCKLCIEMCPYGAIFPHPSENVVLVCDLCGGDPACVRYCPTGALEYEKPLEAFVKRKSGEKGI